MQFATLYENRGRSFPTCQQPRKDYDREGNQLYLPLFKREGNGIIVKAKVNRNSVGLLLCNLLVCVLTTERKKNMSFDLHK